MEQSVYGPVDIDVRLHNDPYMMAYAMVPAGTNVLDVGAAEGSFARLLTREAGCKVWGVEVNPVTAAEAKDVCEDVVVGDVESLDLAEQFAGLTFGAVTLLDVLEHLLDPAAVLAAASALLAPNGRVIASIPNVTHASVRLQLLEGRFTYTDHGLLDRTHLRFFDRESVEALFADAGLTVLSIRRVTRMLGETEIPVDETMLLDGMREMVTADDEAWTYQFVVTAVPEGSVGEGAGRIEPVAWLQDRLREEEEAHASAAAHAEGLRAKVRSLEMDYNNALVQVSQTEAEYSAMLHQRDREIAVLSEAKAELDRLRSTRLYRWTILPRRAYTLLRRVLRGL